MIQRRMWMTVRRRRSLEGYIGHMDKWQVKRVGWFLFGIVPLFITDIEVERLDR